MSMRNAVHPSVPLDYTRAQILYIFRETRDVPLRSLLFTSNILWCSRWKMISKSGTRPSWPLVNVKLTHFIFSHLPFSVHTSAISARSLLTACVCVLCVWLVTEFTWTVSSGVVELVRLARPDPRDVKDGGGGGQMWNVRSLWRFVCVQCIFTCQAVCVWAIDPAYKIWHPYIPLLCIRWGKRKRSLAHTFLPGAPQMLLHALMAPVAMWWIGPGGLS